VSSRFVEMPSEYVAKTVPLLSNGRAFAALVPSGGSFKNSSAFAATSQLFAASGTSSLHPTLPVDRAAAS
jgi:hypothetical protein